MVEAECKKTGEELLQKYNNYNDSKECFEGFIEYAQKAQKELETAIFDYRLKCNKSGSEGSELFKKIEKQEREIKEKTKKNPEIKIGKQTRDFDTLFMSAGAMLRMNNDASEFEEFKKEGFVEDVIKAFD